MVIAIPAIIMLIAFYNFCQGYKDHKVPSWSVTLYWAAVTIYWMSRTISHQEDFYEIY